MRTPRTVELWFVGTKEKLDEVPGEFEGSGHRGQGGVRRMERSKVQPRCRRSQTQPSPLLHGVQRKISAGHWYNFVIGAADMCSW